METILRNSFKPFILKMYSKQFISLSIHGGGVEPPSERPNQNESQEGKGDPESVCIKRNLIWIKSYIFPFRIQKHFIHQSVFKALISVSAVKNELYERTETFWRNE